MRFANQRNLPPSTVLRLPWPAWGETDVMLGMAADLHDKLMCSCGCGQWLEDAHDPAKADLWRVSYDVCYVRRAIDTYVKGEEPPTEAVLRVELFSSKEDRKASAKDRVEGLRAMMRAGKSPVPDEAPQQPDAADEGGDDADAGDGGRGGSAEQREHDPHSED